MKIRNLPKEAGHELDVPSRPFRRSAYIVLLGRNVGTQHVGCRVVQLQCRHVRAGSLRPKMHDNIITSTSGLNTDLLGRSLPNEIVRQWKLFEADCLSLFFWAFRLQRRHFGKTADRGCQI